MTMGDVPRWWTCVKGAAKYLEAWAAGDRAAPVERARRANTCAVCPALTRWRVPALAQSMGFAPVYYTCGERERDGEDVPVRERTCMCVVLAQAVEAEGETREDDAAEGTLGRVTHLTVGGVAVESAGKVIVGSERCPRGNW